MKKLMVLVTLTAVVAVLTAGLVGLFDSTPQSVYASRLAGISGAGATGIQIQNLDATQSATIVSEFYKQGASGAPVTITSPNVPAGGAANIFLPQAQELQNGAYAAIISADRQIAAIARTDWFSSGGAAIYSNVQPGLEVAVPLAVIDYVGTTSLVSIQNTDTSQQATVTVELFSTSSPTAVLTQNYDIQPGTSITLDLGKNPEFVGVTPNTELGFLGSMKVSSQVPVGVQSFVDIETSDKAVYAFEGVPPEQGADTLYAPLVRKQFFGYDTGISVVNPNSGDVDVTVRYIGGDAGGASSCGGQEFTHGPVTIAGGSSSVFYQGPGGNSGLPDGCVGSAVIEASGNVLAIVNDSLNFTEQSAAYNAVSAATGATKVALPLARRQHVEAWKVTTGIQVMNIGDSNANVTITFSDDQGNELTGCGSPCTATVASNQAHTFYPGGGGLNVMPAGTYGSAVVTSDQDIVVIVNDASEVGAIDAATYNGIKADGN
jgi:hypothetical protein